MSGMPLFHNGYEYILLLFASPIKLIIVMTVNEIKSCLKKSLINKPVFTSHEALEASSKMLIPLGLVSYFDRR